MKRVAKAFINRKLVPDLQEMALQNLNFAERAVFLSLAKRMDDNLFSRQSHEDIAFFAGCHRDTVVQCLASLEQKGYIVVRRELGKRNQYQISEVLRNDMVKHLDSIDQKTDYLREAVLHLSYKKPILVAPQRSAHEILNGLRK